MIPFIVLLVAFGVLSLVFAVIEPPPMLARLAGRKVLFLFALLPPPWDRRVGFTFNGLVSLGLAAWLGYTYYVL